VIDEGIVRGLIALVSLVTFIGICWWAYRPASRERFEQDALLVFEEEEHSSGSARREAAAGSGTRAERGVRS
jgi:cbb3-type cytochrome oxidase subunit 3